MSDGSRKRRSSSSAAPQPINSRANNRRTAAQAEKKRVQDREAQRNTRQRTKEYVIRLETRIAELESPDPIAKLTATIRNLEARVRHLESGLGAICRTAETLRDHNPYPPGKASEDSVSQDELVSLPHATVMVAPVTAEVGTGVTVIEPTNHLVDNSYAVDRTELEQQCESHTPGMVHGAMHTLGSTDNQSTTATEGIVDSTSHHIHLSMSCGYGSLLGADAYPMENSVLDHPALASSSATGKHNGNLSPYVWAIDNSRSTSDQDGQTRRMLGDIQSVETVGNHCTKYGTSAFFSTWPENIQCECLCPPWQQHFAKLNGSLTGSNDLGVEAFASSMSSTNFAFFPQHCPPTNRWDSKILSHVTQCRLQAFPASAFGFEDRGPDINPILGMPSPVTSPTDPTVSFLAVPIEAWDFDLPEKLAIFWLNYLFLQVRLLFLSMPCSPDLASCSRLTRRYSTV